MIVADSVRRKILLTGATGGIGLALTNRLAQRHDVLAVGRKSQKEIASLLPDGVHYCRVDLANPSDATQAIASALLKLNWTALDNAVLNAGTGYAVEAGVETVEQVRKTLDTNLLSSVLLAHTLFPWLSKANGTLSLIGSVAHKGQGLFPSYAASKAGLHGFARALQSEWQGRVAVQIIHPGPTRTAMHEKAGYDPGGMAKFFIKPEAAAAMIEGAMASRKSPVTVSFAKAWTAGAARARALP